MRKKDFELMHWMFEKEDIGEDIYSHKKRELLLEDDELSDGEEAFMKGYEEAG